MRDKLPDRFEEGRLRDGYYASKTGDMHGAFSVTSNGADLKIMSSGSQDGWEHVSVSLKHRTPNWAEMCFVKNAFWRPDECVMQLHPPEADYVNIHPNVLHLWRPLKAVIPMPPKIMV